MLDYDEFALKRIQHGIVLGTDGNKMSKSKGNVINPDDVVKEYGSDTARLYLCFMMPYEGTGAWSTQTIAGVYRFLSRIWKIYQEQYQRSNIKYQKEDEKLVIKLKKTVKKVTEEISNIKMNTSIAMMMEFLNDYEKSLATNHQPLTTKHAKQFLQILAPFAPFITEEIWRNVFDEKESIHLSVWPKVVGEIVEEEIILPVQVNGKLRDTVKIQRLNIKDQKAIEGLIMQSEKVKKYITGKPKKVIYVPGKIINFIV